MRRPTFFSVSVASLGLGIGSAAAVAIVANALFFRPPAGVFEPERLVAVFTSRDDGTSYGHSSYPDYRNLAASVAALEGVAASEYDVVRMDEGGARLFTERVTGNCFDVLGARPAAGRAFLPTEARPGSAEAVVVISHSLWRRQFGGAAEAVGRPIHLSGRVYTIIGVAPRGLASRFLAFSLAPAIQAGRSAVPASLRREPASLVVGGRRVSPRNVLVVAQFAAAVVLVSGAALVVRSLHAACSASTPSPC